ncbi:hypothetical protein [Kaistella carnis]|uniref:hypothetical protein n=1 Tax=Kaistella carnis TaxID=1241979 RepID=UPI0028AA0C20|nr:hypothetical protein [Kaistella carnis]
MKKLSLLLAVLNFSFAISQCTITGAAQVQVGERQTYSVEVSKDLPANSYEWIYMDQKMIPQSELNLNSLTVKGSVPGKSVLSLEIKTAAGTSKCEKSIEVIAPLSVSFDSNAQKCNIEIDAFKEVRISDTNVALEAIAPNNNFNYQWTVHYRNGSKKVSNEKVGTFAFSNEKVIDLVELNVTDKKCTKKISKTYNHNFWYFF